MRNAVRLIVVCASLLAWPLAHAAVTVESFASISGSRYGLGCQPRAQGGLDCGGGSQDSFYADESLRTDTGMALVQDSVANPSGIGAIAAASARAQTDAFSNRVRVSALGGDSVGMDSFGNTIARGGEGIASAYSRWTAPMTLAGGVGSGVAFLRVALTGSIDRDGRTPEVAGASVGFTLTSGIQSSYGYTDDGVFDDTRDFAVLFQHGVPFQLVGELAADASVTTQPSFISEGGQDGSDVIVTFDANVAVDFFGTARVVRLIVPVGTTAVGAGGAALPFPVVAVPEPGAALLMSLGLAAVALVAAPRRRRAAAH